jgi:hypothetical protein
LVDLAIQELDGHKLWRYLTKSETKLPNPVEQDDKIFTGGTKINIFNDVDGKPCFLLGSGRSAKLPSAVDWDGDVIAFWHKCQEKMRVWTQLDKYKLSICTEQKRNGQIFVGILSIVVTIIGEIG